MRILLADEVGKPLVIYEGDNIYEVNGTYLSILKSIEEGKNTFTTIYKSHTISSKTLADKLGQMIECGILTKKENPESKRSVVYELNVGKSSIVSTPYTDTLVLIIAFILVKLGIFTLFNNLSLANSVVDAIFLTIILGYTIFVRRKFKTPKK